MTIASDGQVIGPHLVARAISRVGDIETAAVGDGVAEPNVGTIAQSFTVVVVAAGARLADDRQ